MTTQRAGGDLAQTIFAILARETHVTLEAIKPEATFEELGIDSLDVINAVFALEEELGIDLPIDKQQGLARVSDVVTWVEQYVRTQEGSAAARP